MPNLLSEVRAILRTTPVRWNDLTQAVPAELLAARPATGEWSALECLAHVIEVDQLCRFRLQAFLEGRDFPAFSPNQKGLQESQPDPAALAVEFTRERLESLALLESVTEVDLERTARHAQLGPVTLRQMLNQWTAHDFNHLIQAERAVMQPFIRDCGAWQVFFSAQVIPVDAEQR